jgi:eukaryotic-like serine/threonine-protein kinase
MSALRDRLEQALRDRYRLDRELGSGGMAVVYLAEDARHRRRVALKVLKPELAQALGADRFLREIDTVAGLTHPNILPLHDSGDAGEGLVYYVMPYVDGQSLRERIVRERQLPIDDALRIAHEVADALAHAHSRGIIHRDIKPENILLQAGHAMVADFGIARAIDAATDGRLTNTGLALGTPSYMSPEQAAGEREVDARSDIYSLGCLLYEMLAGEPPFTGATAQAILARKAVAPVPQLSIVRDTVPADVEAIVNKALAKAPADRFATAAQFGDAIRRSLAELATNDSGSQSLRKSRSDLRSDAYLRTNRRRWGIAAAVVVVLLAAAGIAQFLRTRTPSERVREEPTALTEVADAATSPALSPDGRMLTFLRSSSTFYGPGEIYVKILPDGELVQITNDSVSKMGPRFTPDGTHITYGVFTATSMETRTVPVLGGQPRLLLANSAGVTAVGGDDGQRRILFSEMTGRDVQLAIVTSTETRGDHRVVYLPPETGMAHRSYLSPDRKNVIVVEMDYYAWLPCRLVPFDGSSTGRRVGPIPAQCTDAAWSPDGKWMYFTANNGNGYHVWRQRFPDGKPEQITHGVTEEDGVFIAPDGKSLVTSIGKRQSTLWVHDERGDRQITSEGYGLSPQISRDRRKLYYMVRANAVGSFISGALWVADLETGERQRLLPGFLIQQFHISADGKRVVFIAADDSVRSPIWLAPLDGHAPPRRLVDREGVQAYFGANGDVVFARRNGERNAIYRIREDGTDLRTVTAAAAVNGVSPDGQWVTTWDAPNSVKIHPIAGGTPTLVCESCVDPATFELGPPAPVVSWSGDGRTFYLQFGKSVYAIPLRAGEIMPPIPPTGFRSESEVAALRGARRLTDVGAFPGPTPSTYAFIRISTQRNIYRVPVP